MTMHWFDMNNVELSFGRAFSKFFENFSRAFSSEMLGMSMTFVIMGTFTGLGFGLYSLTIKNQQKELKTHRSRVKDDLIAKIKNGEDAKTEFKSSLRYDYYTKSPNTDLESVVTKTIAGFLNASGGQLIIGVDDDGKILGIEKDYISLKKKNKDGFELRIFQLISQEIGQEFCHLVHLNIQNIEGKDVCMLDVKKSASPVYVTKKNDTTFFLRIGNATKPLSVKETVDYLQSNA